MSDFFDKLVAYESLVVAFVTLISTFVGLWLKTKLAREREDRELENATIKNEHILLLLKRLIKTLDADRAYIFEFHNGNYFSSGLPMQKFTCTYEVVEDGISAECHNPGEYRVSNFNEYIMNIIKQRDFIIEDVDGMQEKPLLKNLLIQKGVKSLYNFPIRDIKDKTIGFIGVDFVKENIKLSEENINQLRAAAKLVTGYIAK